MSHPVELSCKCESKRGGKNESRHRNEAALSDQNDGDSSEVTVLQTLWDPTSEFVQHLLGKARLW